MGPNWDGSKAKPIDIDSVKTLSAFFRDTRLKPQKISIFMGQSGYLGASWTQPDSGEIEIEFLPGAVDAYSEHADQDRVFLKSDLGFTEAKNFICHSI